MAFEDLIPFLKQRKPPADAREGGREAGAETGAGKAGLAGAGPEAERDAWRTRAHAYKKVVERYADYIESKEKKTLPELKALVNARDEAVLAVKRELEKRAAESGAAGEEGLVRLAFEFASSLKAIDAELGVPYWFSPKEIVELRAADAFDRAIFLCSLVRAFDATARVLVLELEGGLKHPVVLWAHAGRNCILDASQAHAFLCYSGSREQALDAYGAGGRKVARVLFEFNDREFEESEAA